MICSIYKRWWEYETPYEHLVTNWRYERMWRPTLVLSTMLEF